MRKLISPHTCHFCSLALLQRQVDWTEFWTNESPLVRREMNEQAISAAATGAHDTRQRDWTGSELSWRTSLNCIVHCSSVPCTIGPDWSPIWVGGHINSPSGGTASTPSQWGEIRRMETVDQHARVPLGWEGRSNPLCASDGKDGGECGNWTNGPAWNGDWWQGPVGGDSSQMVPMRIYKERRVLKAGQWTNGPALTYRTLLHIYIIEVWKTGRWTRTACSEVECGLLKGGPWTSNPASSKQ